MLHPKDLSCSHVATSWVGPQPWGGIPPQQRLREEVLSVLGPSAVPTGKQLQELHYVKAIITEALRCVTCACYMHACMFFCEFLNGCVSLCVVHVRVGASPL